MAETIRKRLARLDWSRIAGSLWEFGYAHISRVLTARECADLRAMYSQDARFRKTIDMAGELFCSSSSGRAVSREGRRSSRGAERSSSSPRPNARWPEAVATSE